MTRTQGAWTCMEMSSKASTLGTAPESTETIFGFRGFCAGYLA